MTIEKKIKKNVSLAPLTTFKIGGRAEFFLEAKTIDELVSALRWSREKGIKARWFGGGSNLLIGDGKISGLVIKLNLSDLSVDGEYLAAAAGLKLAAVLGAAYSQGLSGLEWAAGVPGSLGGAVIGNAGAFGQSVGDVVETVAAIDLKKISPVIFNRRQCKFSYRSSLFKEKKDLIICLVRLKLVRRGKSLINKKMADCLSYRINSQPKGSSAGSVFKNIEFTKLKSQHKKLLNLAVKHGKIKNNIIPAGWVIEQSGLKFRSCGGAKISGKHANFIVNAGHAKAEDVKKLISLIKQKVYKNFKINLEEEIQYF